MKTYRLRTKQTLPISLQQVWDYFSNPNNLRDITPPDLNMTVRTDTDGRIYNGMVIEYHVTPLAGLRVRWLTEIKHVNAPYMFVDEQRFGPYQFWYHQHFFQEVNGGVEVTDLIYYRIPFSLLSPLINRLVVEGKLSHIFNFRRQVLADKFGTVGKRAAE
ncbi:MAG: SRPBCC family protein [Candidatus Omnitrophica bacterium]|nr:SRPBCC family protein [Candidatus Omnitrophota bacterium]MCB9720412.1 SRPBCC family protein [Candidatus Omnitrophota bacterium]